ncbi:MAG: hypothetical protein K8Q97_01990 [Candidatus Andersenbacteria bacterium]|nr:hypothetical protein [Candidatus Andersenbacteria bacterium]
MEFTDQQLSQFQQLYFKHFHEKITKEKAAAKGERLIQLVKTVYESKAARHKQQERQQIPT